MKLIQALLLKETEQQTIDIRLLPQPVKGKRVVLAKYGDETVGALRLVPYKDTYAVDTVQVKPDYRRHGIGTEMYRTAVDKFKTIYSDKAQSPAAKGLWEKLIKTGEAKQDSDGRYYITKK